MKKMIFVIAMALICQSVVCQTWKHQTKYDRYVKNYPQMSDDEISGIYLEKAGVSLMTSLGLEIVGAGVSVAGSFIEDKNLQTIAIYSGVGICAIGIIEFFVGSSQVRKAGIILQHKRFSIQTTGTSMVVKF